jgi:PAS domain S-box-containing protein
MSGDDHMEHDLFLLMLHLYQLKDEDRIKEMFLESVNSLNDNIRLALVPSQKKKEDGCCEIMEIATAKNSFGFISLDAAPETIDKRLKSLLKNSIAMLALILENHRNEMLLDNEKMMLKEAVRERTADLERTNLSLKQEIAERKRVEREYVDSRRFIKHIVDTTPSMVYLYDLEEKRIVFSNQQVALFLGQTQDQNGQTGTLSIVQNIHPDDAPLVKKHYDSLRDAADGVIVEQFFRVRHADGSWRKLKCRDVPFARKPDGSIYQVLGIAEDISEQIKTDEVKKLLEGQLRQSQKMEAVGMMAGGIAHDFNNIIAIIIANADLLLEDMPKDDPCYRPLREIQIAGLRAKNITGQLLSFGRKDEPYKEPIDLVQSISETEGLLRASIPASIDIRLNLGEDGSFIMGDAIQIQQVLFNLCTNAVHAMEKNGGILEIRLSEITLDGVTAIQYPGLSEGRYVKLSVSDTGSGIEPEVKEKIFDPYFTTKDVGKGTGLGLSVVHGIVKIHNGAINVYSEVGQGTTINVAFPMIQEKKVTVVKKTEDSPRGNEKVLFVDDEKGMVNVGTQLLAQLGYQAMGKNDPLEALELFESDPASFDLVITDLTMPGMSGDCLIQKMRNVRADMPCILISGYSEKLSNHLMPIEGIGRYLEKPFTKSEFAYTIRNVLNSAKQPAVGVRKTGG